MLLEACSAPPSALPVMNAVPALSFKLVNTLSSLIALVSSSHEPFLYVWWIILLPECPGGCWGKVTSEGSSLVKRVLSSAPQLEKKGDWRSRLVETEPHREDTSILGERSSLGGFQTSFWGHRVGIYGERHFFPWDFFSCTWTQGLSLPLTTFPLYPCIYILPLSARL